MSNSRPVDNLPSTARAIALLLSSTPGVQDAQPGVLHQLLEFSHRYSMQVLTDASVYAEHAGHTGKIEMDDIVLAVQARVGWEFGGRVPKEYTLSLATEVNAAPLPPVPEVFGVRLPPASECLSSVDFDLVPNKPPPGVKIYDEEVEELEEESSDEEEDMQVVEPERQQTQGRTATPSSISQEAVADTPFPISAIATPSDIEMLGTPGMANRMETEEGSDADDDGLFAGGDDEEEESDGMEEVQTAPGASTNGVKRKLVEEDDYD
ncbi:TFIID-31kDa-domain-containing protein [Coprinopsis marcescibilis]|uniref:TFIID-31kDa-domain-containing protein n=1 Tax=Coprinopsis marcescibilis TaxID=230819 RepID=A0A5C3L9V0_COPMA|nr:TFIID-31kDa-domain-containing protein [Coprinopsis marcescibilis]